MDNASARLREVLNRIEAACGRCGRNAGEVTLIGAAKTVPAERIREFLEAGLDHVGENYVQEAKAKQDALSDLTPSWHLIGALQSNKARDAVNCFEAIHSVDRASLANALQKEAAAINKVQEVLLQVNLGDEESKAGCSPAELEQLVERCRELPNLAVRGLMCLPPYCEDLEEVRPYFKQLRELRDRWHPAGVGPELSMGMSHDYEVAIEEGATMVRIGTALFGARKK